MSQANPIVQIENVHKRFGKVHALCGISTTVRRGEVLVLIGPSGSGKSTLLRCINGLERPDAGRVIVNGIPLDNSSDHINAVRAEVGNRRNGAGGRQESGGGPVEEGTYLA